MTTTEAPENKREDSPGSRFALILATAAGAGYAPIAPGTAGSAVALPIFVLLSRMDLVLYGLTVATLAVLGVWAASEAERRFGREDDGRIVIDEVAGQLVTLLPLVPQRALLGERPWTFFGFLVTGFVVFRVFDIWKPGPVRWAERRFTGGLGVMMDDLLAGAMCAVLLAAALFVWGSG